MVGAILYLRIGLAEVRADVPPSQFESALMRMAVHASVRRHAPEIANPIAPNEENLIAGGKIYLGECSGCHGTPGKAPTGAETLNPPAPRLPEVGTEYSEAQIFWVAKHGVRRAACSPTGFGTAMRSFGPSQPTSYRIKNLPPRVSEAINNAAKSGG